MKNCPMCGSSVQRERLDVYPYTESGLADVVLEGVIQVRCVCGEMEGVEIPAVDQLNRELVHHLVRHEGRRTGAEIRFLRTWLGWSGKVFANKLGVTPETVSRWEHGTKEMNLANERLLRLYVACGQQDREYSIEDTEKVRHGRSMASLALKMRLQDATGRWLAA